MCFWSSKADLGWIERLVRHAQRTENREYSLCLRSRIHYNLGVKNFA